MQRRPLDGVGGYFWDVTRCDLGINTSPRRKRGGEKTRRDLSTDQVDNTNGCLEHAFILLLGCMLFSSWKQSFSPSICQQETKLTFHTLFTAAPGQTLHLLPTHPLLSFLSRTAYFLILTCEAIVTVPLSMSRDR